MKGIRSVVGSVKEVLFLHHRNKVPPRSKIEKYFSLHYQVTANNLKKTVGSAMGSNTLMKFSQIGGVMNSTNNVKI